MEAYLETLPEAVISRLFRSPASCLALLRLLPPLAKVIVMRLLFSTAPVSMKSIQAFVTPAARRQQLDALQKLRNLKILKEKFTTGELEIHQTFQQSLQTAITSGPANHSFEETGSPVAVATLEKYQRERWESMLYFMVSSAQIEDGQIVVSPSGGLSDIFLALLVKSGLLSRGRRITSDGFQFLLQDQQTQVWSLLLHYLSNASELEMDPTDILNFIFRLGTLEKGRGHSVEQLPVQYRRVLNELAELGIVYVRQGVFYAALQLTSDEPKVAKETSSKKITTEGFIIIETNYRLYAYTDSPLQISVLNLFCDMKFRFANLVVGRLTRHSTRKAMANGITADQIVQYLQSNQKGGGALPPTIIDQIRLWQLELDRFRQAPGFLFQDFVSAKQYTLVVQFAQDVGALLWKNDRTRAFFVEERSVKDVTEFVNRMSTTDRMSEPAV